MKLVSLFSGAGGLDLGFHQEGFRTIWANEYNRFIVPTFKHNFPDVTVVSSSISNIDSLSVPDCDGIIGGPPCQSWSIAGASRGIDDSRGQLFFEYVRILKTKQPQFFVAENVPGILHRQHSESFAAIKQALAEAGYDIFVNKLNAADYGVPQTRERVIIVGYRSDLHMEFVMPDPIPGRRTQRDVIYDLRTTAQPALNRTRANPETRLALPNHEYYAGNFTGRYMSRNRVRDWDSPSFTMVSNMSGCTAHPDSGRMIRVDRDHHYFEHPEAARRFTIREAARLQTFPDDFKFIYDGTIEHGYTMVGNAVPVRLAQLIARTIRFEFAIKRVNDNIKADFKSLQSGVVLPESSGVAAVQSDNSDLAATYSPTN